MAQKQQSSSKNSIKRTKFNPKAQKTNEERQLETAAEEQAQKVQMAKDPSTVSMDGLKQRLAIKLQAMRDQRKADEKNGKKRKLNTTSKTTEMNTKKRKHNATHTPTKSNGTTPTSENTNKTNTLETVEVSGSSISYGSLLLADEKKTEVTKTRNGQALRGIKNLLKKAERNQQRIEELKKTDEGKALVEAKGWSKALKQAAGEIVMDDPKLLRKKLKKKEKAKTKSSKDWYVDVCMDIVEIN